MIWRVIWLVRRGCVDKEAEGSTGRGVVEQEATGHGRKMGRQLAHLLVQLRHLEEEEGRGLRASCSM